MSSYEDGESARRSQKRKVPRACDACRKRKTRCEPVEGPGDLCSNCDKLGYSKCFFEEAPPPKRGRYKDQEYVLRLETRLVRLEALFHRLHPEMDLDGLLEQNEPPVASQALSIMPEAAGTDFQSPRTGGLLSGFIHPAVEVPPVPDYDHDLVNLGLLDDFGKLAIHQRGEGHFFGKSSSVMLLQSAFDLKQELTGLPDTDTPHSRILEHRRQEFWSLQSWESLASLEMPSPAYNFPDADLMLALIDNYFGHHNRFLPFLHRPTFERSIQDGLHLRHDTFGAIVLLVCANGARHSDDPRVLLEDSDSKLSSGWKWFRQVQIMQKSFVCSPTLYDLQFYILVIRFLQGSSVGHTSWILIGVALRIAQEVGVHRKKRNNNPPSLENELWKRAFWALIFMDRVMSSLLGRPSAIRDEEVDLDFPLEVDDEYWEHPDPNQAFKQPPQKPSFVSSFNCSLRLIHILEEGRRVLYFNNKSKLLLGLVGEWEQPVVAQIDSLMNKWIDSLPEHLRWDPSRKSDIFFDQSAELHCQFYYVQMVIHRPFLRSSSPLALPSMAICANSARNCSNVISVHSQSASSSVIPMAVLGAFTSSVVLLLHLWSAKRSGLATNQQKDLSDVHKCMQVLRKIEGQFIVAGRLWDILSELANVGDLPIPRPYTATEGEGKDVSFAPLSEPRVSSTPQTRSHIDEPRPTDHPAAPPLPSPYFFTGSDASELPASHTRTTQLINQPESDLRDNAPHFYDQLVSGYGESFQPLDTTNGWQSMGTDEQNPATMLPQVMFDNGTMDLWMGAPSSFELEDWGPYLSSVDDLTHGTIQ